MKMKNTLLTLGMLTLTGQALASDQGSSAAQLDEEQDQVSGQGPTGSDQIEKLPNAAYKLPSGMYSVPNGIVMTANGPTPSYDTITPAEYKEWLQDPARFGTNPGRGVIATPDRGVMMAHRPVKPLIGMLKDVKPSDKQIESAKDLLEQVWNLKDLDSAKGTVKLEIPVGIAKMLHDSLMFEFNLSKQADAIRNSDASPQDKRKDFEKLLEKNFVKIQKFTEWHVQWMIAFAFAIHPNLEKALDSMAFEKLKRGIARHLMVTGTLRQHGYEQMNQQDEQSK